MATEDRRFEEGRVPAVVGTLSQGYRNPMAPRGEDGVTAPNRRPAGAPEGAIPWDYTGDWPENCTATTKAGVACKGRPIEGTGLCVFHTPKADAGEPAPDPDGD